MHTHFNKTEREIFEKLMKLVSEYDKAEKNKDQVFQKIQLVCPEMDRGFLEEYWRSQGIEEFCSIHSVQKAAPATDSESKSIIEQILKCVSEDNFECSEYLVEKYSDYYEVKYGCSTGTFRDVVFDESSQSVNDVISELRKNGPIIL